MPTIYLTTGNALAVIRPDSPGGSPDGPWRADIQMLGRDTYCVDVDPLKPEVVYCGTFGQGLWVSRDAGASWQPVGEGITHVEVTAVAVSLQERFGDTGVVWVGTEPSTLFRSEDGGRTWHECSALRELPSAPTWSFPPRPWTHHVRWIAPDPNVAGRIFVGIELGGVMRSQDAGRTWEDRKPGGQHDAHYLRTHRQAPGRVYEAAGGGYAESHDAGASWLRLDEGMLHHYCWSVAVDPAEPNLVLVSASRGPMQAHRRDHAEATVYRKTKGQPWHEARNGLPEPKGTRVYALASSEHEPGVFYAATHEGRVFQTADAAMHWHELNITWPEAYTPNTGMPPALVVT